MRQAPKDWQVRSRHFERYRKCWRKRVANTVFEYVFKAYSDSLESFFGTGLFVITPRKCVITNAENLR